MNLGEYRFRKGDIYMAPYLVVITCFFLFFVLSYFNSGFGVNSVRIDADSFVYIGLNEIYDDILLLFAINPNAIGPLFLLRLTDSNFFFIFVINLFLFIASYKVLINNFEVKSSVLIILFIINPLFIPAITTLNKEIFGIASVSFYLSYLSNKRKRFFILSLVFGAITRWQMVFIVLFFHAFKKVCRMVNLGRGLSLIGLILLLSILHPIFFSNVTNVIDATTQERQQETGGGIINLFNGIQEKYMYFIAVFPKVIFNLFGNFFRIIPMVLEPSSANIGDVYNNVFLLGHQIVMFVLTLILFWRKKLDLKNDVVYFCCIYLIVFSLGPMIQYRYIFPLYSAIAVIISKYPKWASPVDVLEPDQRNHFPL